MTDLTRYTKARELVLAISKLTDDEKKCGRVANEATIYYKTLFIAQEKGLKEALKYFTGTHDENEYTEILDGGAWTY